MKLEKYLCCIQGSITEVFGAFSNKTSHIKVFYSIFRAVDVLHVVVSGKL
jgi:hypothetical protein